MVSGMALSRLGEVLPCGTISEPEPEPECIVQHFCIDARSLRSYTLISSFLKWAMYPVVVISISCQLH